MTEKKYGATSDHKRMEPVAWMHRHENEIIEFNSFPACKDCEPLYLHPTPQPDVTELVEAAKKALEALEWNWGGEPMPSLEFEAMGLIREALHKLERKQTSAEIQGR